jgi:hypothetical protein
MNAPFSNVYAAPEKSSAADGQGVVSEFIPLICSLKTNPAYWAASAGRSLNRRAL